MSRRLYLAAYDISHPRRLRAALHLVKGYATGGQKSAYECWLTESDREDLLHDMALVLDERTDRFILISLDPRATTLSLGKGQAPADAELFFLN